MAATACGVPANAAAIFAAPLGLSADAELTGLLHDLGKYAKRFQARHPHLSLESESSPGAGDSLSKRLVESAPNPAQACEVGERAVAVRRAIAGLPEDLRIALTLAEYEDRSMADIAEITQSSVKAVESRLYRARKDLRSSLADWLKL